MKSLLKKAFATVAATAVLSVPAVVTPGIAGAMTLDQYKSIAMNASQAKLVSDGDKTFIGKDSNGNLANVGWRSENYPAAFKNAVKSGRVVELWYHSPSMNRDVPVLWLRPDPKKVDRSKPMPTLYYLNGADGGEGTANWFYQTDIVDFFADKAVNVIVPMAGKFSYYTDWVQEEPRLGGKQKWETFLTKELPGPLEKKINGNGKRGIEGMSMSATTSLAFAEHNPGFYDAVASYSGCADTSTPLGQTAVDTTMFWGGQLNSTKMWGAKGNGIWRYNSALLHSKALKGTPNKPLHVYVSNASGATVLSDLPNPKVNPNNPAEAAVYGSAQALGNANTALLGGGIEAATNMCTHDLKVKLDREGTKKNVHFEFHNHGAHAWPTWKRDMRKSWTTTFGPAFGMK